MEPRRHLADMFLNTNNPVVSNIFGFNNNVAMGNRNCIFYVTLYTTKGTQNEEQFPFVKHCTAIAKRTRKFREHQNLLLQKIGNDVEHSEHTIDPNFSVGLGHVLSGIMAHLSSSVISATLAWHLVIEESRFRFSHEFSQILLSQFESWLLGGDIQFRFRRIKSNETGWIDCNTFQYIYLPDNEEFEDMSVWQFFKEYEMKLISTLSMSQKEDLENDCIENQFFKFKDIYIGSNFACVAKMKKPSCLCYIIKIKYQTWKCVKSIIVKMIKLMKLYKEVEMSMLQRC
jgi:hypothetical protein